MCAFYFFQIGVYSAVFQDCSRRRFTFLPGAWSLQSVAQPALLSWATCTRRRGALCSYFQEDSPSWMEDWDCEVVGLVQVSGGQRDYSVFLELEHRKKLMAFLREHGYLLYGK